MAIRKAVEEAFVVAGPRDLWLARVTASLRAGGFGNVAESVTLYQVQGTYRKPLAWGEILVTLLPDGDNTKVLAKATANVDNIWALFSSPTKRILATFKSNLG
jgi:hypothetical protein